MVQNKFSEIYISHEVFKLKNELVIALNNSIDHIDTEILLKCYHERVNYLNSLINKTINNEV